MNAPNDGATKTTYRLEISDQSQFCPKYSDMTGLAVRQLGIPSPELNWFFHEVIGSRYDWGGRSDWDMNRWREHVERDELQTWVLSVSETPAGYCELERQALGVFRILSFGILESFVGQGLGAHFLSEMLRRAWQQKASSVWLTTCTHDHAHALANYQARGFSITDTSIEPANQPRSTVLPT